MKPKCGDFSYELHEYGLDLLANHIYLFGNDQLVNTTYSPDTPFEEPGVEFTMANRLIKNLHACQFANPGKPILIHLKTNGGSWVEGMAIYDAIKACPSWVTAINYTHARSMSSLIFLACDKRVMMPHSYFMFHEGTVEFGGTYRQFRTEFEWGERGYRQMVEIYLDALMRGNMAHLGREAIEEWGMEQMRRKEEVYFDAEDAVGLGFADCVFDGAWDDIHA